jgi:hypothetical protein
MEQQTVYSFKWKTEERLQKILEDSLNFCYFVYTSLHAFTNPDKGQAVGKMLKHSMCTFVKEGIEGKKFSISDGLQI